MAAEPNSRAEQLQQAFRSFEQVSRELSRSYRSLERRVSTLTGDPGAVLAAAPAAGRFKAVFEALPGGVVVLDGDGCIEASNAAAERLLGPLERGSAWREVVARVVAPRWDDGHDMTLSSGRRVNISTEALADQPGQVLLINDVTENRRLHDDVGRWRRLAAAGELAAALAHQVRTPLAAALLYASNLRRAELAPERRTHYAERVIERLRHLERLVEDMLLYARCGSFEREPLALEALLEGLVAASEAQTGAGRFRLEIIDGAGPVLIDAHRDALLSALHNLVANAHEACFGAGQLQLSCRHEPAGILELRFTDDGPGVDPHAAETIFEPFYTRRADGSGLGLAVVRAVVHAHGGEVRVDTGAGPGACFVVRLPCRAGHTAIQAEHPRKEPQ